MDRFYTLRVKKIERNTDHAVTVFFEIPPDLKEIFRFKAGQYLTIRKKIDNAVVTRAYSVCTAPHEKAFAVGIKKMKNGLFSTFAHQALKSGDTLEVMPPKGRFVIDKDHITTIASIAAGSGITPILSILKSHLAAKPTHKAVLFYGNKSIANTMFYKDIAQLEQQYQNRFQVVYAFTASSEKDTLFGRIDQNSIHFVFKNKFREISFEQFFICGPKEMMTNITTALKNNGVSDTAIKYELFSSETSPEEQQTLAPKEGTIKITVKIDEETTTFLGDSSKVLLDAILSEDLDPPYSCQGGVCSSCIARVTEGEAIMRQNQVLTDTEIKEGLVLTCQAHAKSSPIKLDFDDV